MLIETIRSLDRLDYPNYEIVVVDNNTRDPAVWQPVARWCAPRRRVRSRVSSCAPQAGRGRPAGQRTVGGPCRDPAGGHAVGAAGLLAAWRRPGALLLGLLVWQGSVYASAPFMAWMSLHTRLSAQLERHRRTERLRERAAQVGPYVGATAGLAAAAAAGVLAALVLAGGAQPATQQPSPFTLPPAARPSVPPPPVRPPPLRPPPARPPPRVRPLPRPRRDSRPGPLRLVAASANPRTAAGG
jgi:hypothetical protein